MYNPYAGYTITETWAGHIARGSAGGIDWAMRVGTPIYATEDGYVSYIFDNGTGGHTATLIRDANHSTQFMHLSGFQGGARNVAEGEVIGWSGGAAGAPGAGSSTGPHLHAHSYEFGRRVVPFFFGAAAGVYDPTPIPGESEFDMILFNLTPQQIAFVIAPGTIVCVPGGPYGPAANDSAKSLGDRNRDQANALLTIAGFGNDWAALDRAAAAPGATIRAVTAGSIDTAPLIKATTDAVKSALANVQIDAGLADNVASQVEARLADEFAAIPAATRTAIIKP